MSHSDPFGSARQVWEFPLGLPAFEQHTRFTLQRDERFAPFLFLASAVADSVRFICLPVAVVAPDYRYRLEAKEADLLGLACGEHALDEPGVVTLATVTLPDAGEPTTNLLAPIILSLRSGKGVQAIQVGSRWSHDEPLRPREEPACL